MRVICTSGPILKDGRSPRRVETALVGNTASQERGNAAMQHSGVSLTPAGGAMGHLRGPASILGQRHTYGLLKSRWAGPGDSNLTATACVQQAFYRFVSGLCTVCGRHTRLFAASEPLCYDPRAVPNWAACLLWHSMHAICPGAQGVVSAGARGQSVLLTGEVRLNLTSERD